MCSVICDRKMMLTVIQVQKTTVTTTTITTNVRSAAFIEVYYMILHVRTYINLHFLFFISYKMIKCEDGANDEAISAFKKPRVEEKQVAEFPNNNTTEGDYRWRLHGRDNVGATRRGSKDDPTFEKKYYI